jgi:hypothetical protein
MKFDEQNQTIFKKDRTQMCGRIIIIIRIRIITKIAIAKE